MKKGYLMLSLACGSLLLHACGGGSSSIVQQPPLATATQLLISPASFTTTAGAALGFTLTAADGSGKLVPGYDGTVHFTSSDSQALLPTDQKLTNGTGTFKVTFKTAGGQSISAVDTVTASISGGISVSVNAGTAMQLSVSAPSAATVLMSFNVTVSALDSYMNVATSYTGTVHLTSSDTQATLQADSPLTNGASSFSVTLKTTGSQTITATDTVTASLNATSSSIKVVTNVATHLAVSSPGATTTRQTFGLTVSALDAANNVSTGYSGTVQFTSSDTKAVLPANSTLPSGMANLSATFETAGNQSITATDTSNAAVTGTSSTSVTGVATLSITSGNPPNGTVGVNYGPFKTQYSKCVFTHYLGPHWQCNPCTLGVSCGSYPRCNGNIYNSPCISRQQVFNGFTLMGSGGIPAYSWSWMAAVGSSLPPGLMVNASNGEILGTPTSPGSYNVTVTVTDSGLPTAQSTANYAIKVNDPPRPAVNTRPVPPTGTINVPYSFTFSASGYPPLTWSESGMLPPGLLFDSSTGVLSGTPTQANSFPIVITASDQFNQSSSASFTIVIAPHGFADTGSMTTARNGHTATWLTNGKVLVTGGFDANLKHLQTAELYDPVAGTFTALPGMMTVTRAAHTATLLSSGKVLIAGGVDDNGNARDTAELFDPATGSFSVITSNMVTAHADHTATLLSDGTVLVVGGVDASGNRLAAAEVFDPSAATFTATGSLATAREQQTATLLANGKVLVTGGFDNAVLASAELYDPSARTFTATSGTMNAARLEHTATLLSSGKVLVAGGLDTHGTALGTAELFDPSSGTFTATNNMITARAFHTATFLTDGTALLAGGLTATGNVTTAVELFDPASGNFSTTGSLVNAREQHSATLLGNGHVLVTGGSNGNAIARAEVYR